MNDPIRYVNKFSSNQWALNLQALEDPPNISHLMSPEDRAEWEARTKEYSRKKMAKHRKWQKVPPPPPSPLATITHLCSVRLDYQFIAIWSTRLTPSVVQAL